MHEPRQRLTIDQIDWQRAFVLPHLTRAVGLAAQPGRLVVALALITIIMAAGSIWDAVAGPVVGPGGLGDSHLEPEIAFSSLQVILDDDSLVAAEIGSTLAANPPATSADVVEMLDQARVAVIDQYHATPEADRDAAFNVRVTEALTSIEALRPMGVFTATVSLTIDAARTMTAQCLQLDVCGALKTIIDAKVIAATVLVRDHRMFAFGFGGFAGFCLILFAAMLCRSIACEFAVNQHVPWPEAMAFALKRWIPLLGTFVLPGLALGLGVLGLLIGGLLMRVPGLDIVGGILYGPALFGSFLAACIIVLMALGGGMFVPAIAVEGTDAPDALARAFSYVKNRPLHYALYVVVLFVLGIVSWLVVLGIFSLTVAFAGWGAGLGDPTIAPAVMSASTEGWWPGDSGGAWRLEGTKGIAGSVIELWISITAGLVAAYAFTYECAAFTVLYFAMRRVTDQQDFEDIWVPGMIEGTMAPERGAVREVAESTQSG